ncbi:TolC family protein [Pararhodospirillum photometricum]|nr:TolC family protein [Pararhodospirillum photometricum]
MKMRLGLSVSFLALLSACAVQPEPFTASDLAQQALDDRLALFKDTAPLAGPMTLDEAMARALAHNLDKRSKMMEEALALGQTEVDAFEMLPKLAANAGYTYRSEYYATRSRDLVTGITNPNINPTYSQDREVFTSDLTMSWNILDFGVSYYTAHQNANRALIAQERRRKAVHTLVQEVRTAFWRTAAYQTLKGDVDRTMQEAQAALERSRIVERENLRAPAEALRYQKSLLETLRQLTLLQQDLSTAPLELAALVNLPPSQDIRVVVPADLAVRIWDMPLERMEDLAFNNNPDLREQGYQTRIAVEETRKAILKLLPGVSLTAGPQYDSNSFLVDQQWFSAGAKLSWSLMNLVAAPTTLKLADTNEKVAEARRLALRMAVLAQVHVAERQFRNAVTQFRQSDALWSVDRRLAELSEARSASNAQGVLERVAAQASSITSQVRRFQGYAQMEQAYAKILSTLGEDPLPPESAGPQASPSGAPGAVLAAQQP